jgi:hypothetical protein
VFLSQNYLIEAISPQTSIDKNSMTPDPKDSLNGYQLVGPSEDGKINNLLAELKARESAQRFQALIDEWLIGILPTNVEQVCNSDPGAATFGPGDHTRLRGGDCLRQRLPRANSRTIRHAHAGTS